VQSVLVVLLALVLSLTVIVGSQNAYAGVPPPDCVGAGKALLPNNEIYIGDESGVLHKVVTSGVDKGNNCAVGTMKNGVSPFQTLFCKDIALNPVDEKLYCVALDALWEIDRSDPSSSDFKGDLTLGGFTIDDINALEFDHGGVLYAARFNTLGSFYNVDTSDGDLQFRAHLNNPPTSVGGRSSGDLIYHHVTGDMFWTSKRCPTSPPESCANANHDGLYLIDLATDTSSFVKSTGHRDVFAGDILTNGNLCFVTNNGRLYQTDLNGNQIGSNMVLLTASGNLLRAFGGTSNQLLLGGVSFLLDTTSLLFAAIQTGIDWITSAMLVGVGLAAFMFRDKNQDKIIHKKRTPPSRA